MKNYITIGVALISITACSSSFFSGETELAEPESAVGQNIAVVLEPNAAVAPPAPEENTSLVDEIKDIVLTSTQEEQQEEEEPAPIFETQSQPEPSNGGRVMYTLDGRTILID